MKLFFTLLTFFLATATVKAGTSAEYETTCKHVDSHKQVKFSGKCAANFGVVDSTGREVRYIITFPSGDVTFFISSSGVVSANNAPAKSIKNSNKLVHIVTKAGAEYFFSSPPLDAM